VVTKGIPFRTAHHIVGTLVARCEKEGKHSLKQLSVDDFNQVIESSVTSVTRVASSVQVDRVASDPAKQVRVTDDVYTCLGAHNVVKRY